MKDLKIGTVFERDETLERINQVMAMDKKARTMASPLHSARG